MGDLDLYRDIFARVACRGGSARSRLVSTERRHQSIRARVAMTSLQHE